METLQLVREIEALPEQARAAIERLVALLNAQHTGRSAEPLPIMRAATPLTAEELAAEAHDVAHLPPFRPDIADGADYIHAVRRGLRQP